MNRPIYNNTHILDDSIMAYDCEYRKDLEKYCDFLEWQIEALMNMLDESEAFFEKAVMDRERLNKALDKACEKLAFTSDERIIEELGSFTLGEINRTKEQWKEWLMKDE